MAIRTSQRFPIRYEDKQLEELDFCSRITHGLNENTTSEDIRARVRELIYRYGWNVAKYPSHVYYTFWALTTGDWWGNFKRTIMDTEKVLDPSDPNIVKYYC